MNISIKEIDENNKSIVDAIQTFINQSNYSDYMQTLEWKNIRNEHQKYALYKEVNHEIVWFCILLEKIDSNGEKYLYAPRGPILDYSNIENLHQYLLDIRHFVLNHHYNKLILNPKIQKLEIEKLRDNQYSIHQKQKYDFEHLLESTRVASLKIYDNENDYLMKMNGKTRYCIRRVERDNLLKIHITENFSLDPFMQLYHQTALRHEFHEHDKSYFEKIFQTYQNKIVCCSVEYQNIPLAMSIHIKHKDVLEYVYGVSSSHHRNLMPCYLLHWTMIKFAKNEGFCYYNFGGVHCKDGDIQNKDYGLLQFKSKFCLDGFQEYEPDIEIIFNKEE